MKPSFFANIAAIFALGALTLAGASAQAETRAVPAYAKVRHISFAGTGCPAGSVAGLFASDLTAFHMYFDDFVAETGPGVPFSAKRKNCQISIDFDLPSGWSYSVASVEYKGYVALDSGVSAQQTSTYYFQGQSAQARLSSTMYGPAAHGYTIRDTLGISGLVWSPCGLSRALNVNSQVLVNSTSSASSGIITLDKIDARVAHVFGIQWRRCN